jgi:hypothetical protein
MVFTWDDTVVASSVLSRAVLKGEFHEPIWFAAQDEGLVTVDAQR